MSYAQQKSALHKDLEALTKGEVFSDPVMREVYATAACIYRIVPRAVVRPAEVNELPAIVDYARQRGIPITARGAGTSMGGQTVGSGIIIDMKAHLGRILSIDPDTRTAVVEPGVVLGDLNRVAREHGLRFPPDPSSGEYATLGGMISNNSSGAHSLKYGDTRTWTRKLKVSLSDGTVTWLERKPVMPPSMSRSPVLENRIYSETPRLLEEYEDAIREERPRVVKNSSGYFVWDLVRDREFDPVPLVVGSEGTLVVLMKAELALDPVPAGRAAALVVFHDLDEAAEAVMRLREYKPAAIEIMDRPFVQVVRSHREDLHGLLPEKCEAVLLIEFEEDDQEKAREMLAAVSAEFGAGNVEEARTPEDAARLWALRKAASPIIYRMPGRRLTRFVEDVVFPPERLAEGIRVIREILKKHGTEAPVLGHAGSGNFHLNPRLSLELREDRETMAKIADEVYDAVIGMGGSISGEHGDGMLRAPYVKKQFPRLYPLFERIKELFDPEGVLNPGKILSTAETIPTEPLRFGECEEEGGPAKEELGREFHEMLLRCHGCGLCRTYCPVTLATGEEAALPRSKVSVLRAVCNGSLDMESPGVHESVEELLSLCTSCRRCITGCPTGIEPAAIIQAFQAGHYDKTGRPLRERILGNAHKMIRAASRMPRLSDALMSGRITRSVGRPLLGISRKAPVPAPTRPGRPLEKHEAAGQEVLLYPGCMGRYADREEELSAAVDVLSSLGGNVSAPALPCCGEPKIGTSDPASAKSMMEELSVELAPYVDKGVPIVTFCPACALVLKHEYPRMLGERGQSIAVLAREFFEYVDEVMDGEEETVAGQMPSVYHRSCHMKALSNVDHVASVLSRLSGNDMTVVEDVCCGLAGVYGMRAENQQVADALSEELREALAGKPGPVISACFSCRLQMRSMGIETVSALKLLSSALKAGQ